MAGWSSLSKVNFAPLQSILRYKKNTLLGSEMQKRMSHHRTMIPLTTRFGFYRFRDMIHYYTLVAAIPLGCLIFYCNCFIGSAKLVPIPEGYTPNHWEYYPHPITRFIARYLFTDEQQEYEKYITFMYHETRSYAMREIDDKVKKLIKERGDYKAYYYRPMLANYARIEEEFAKDELEQPSYLK